MYQTFLWLQISVTAFFLFMRYNLGDSKMKFVLNLKYDEKSEVAPGASLFDYPPSYDILSYTLIGRFMVKVKSKVKSLF